MLENYGEFDYVLREMEENTLKKLASEELEDRFDKLMNNMKDLNIYKNDPKFEMDVDFLLNKFKDIEDEKKAKYLEQLENIFKEYYAQNDEYLESLEALNMEEIDLEQENQDVRKREEMLSNLEPDMELIDDIESKSLQKILYFYYHSRRSQGRKEALENFIIQEDETTMVTETNQRIRNATLSAKFQKEIRDIKQTVVR